jgi:hypothetical protein
MKSCRAAAIVACAVTAACTGSSSAARSRGAISATASPSRSGHVQHHHHGGPNGYREHRFVSGIESITAAKGSRIACADRRIIHVRRGARVRLAVRLGTQRASLVGVESGHYYPTAEVAHARLTLRGAGGALTYRPPRWGAFGSKAAAITPIGSKAAHGYVCLVRFHADEPAVAVVGVNPIFMGGGPELILLAPGSDRRHVVHAGFENWAIDDSGPNPVIKTTDSRFFGIGGYDADSGSPLNFYTVDNGELLNISAAYPAEIRAEAADWWRHFERPRHGPYLGAIATWAADECTLGNQAYAFATLDRLQSEGKFRRFKVLRHTGFRHVSYAAHLKRFLAKTGYSR